MLEIYRYRDERGCEPFSDWLNGLRDKIGQARIRMRIRQLECGNFGDCKSVGEGVLEMRVHVGPGYRIYFGRQGDALIILLCAGDKRQQSKDIRNAQELWSHWKKLQSWSN